MPRPLRVARVGYSFMGVIHAQGWVAASRFFDLGQTPEIPVDWGRNIDAVADFAQCFCVGRAETDWRTIIADPDNDVADICTPGSFTPPSPSRPSRQENTFSSSSPSIILSKKPRL